MTVTTSANAERLLTPGEVAALFRVDPKTVTRWASAGASASPRCGRCSPTSRERPRSRAFTEPGGIRPTATQRGAG